MCDAFVLSSERHRALSTDAFEAGARCDDHRAIHDEGLGEAA
jgi:hypothetical protein